MDDPAEAPQTAVTVVPFGTVDPATGLIDV